MHCTDKERFLATIVEVNKRVGVAPDVLDLIESYSALRLARNRDVDFYNGARPVSEDDTVLRAFLQKNPDLDDRTKNFLTAYFQEMRDARLTCVLSCSHLAHLLGTPLAELHQLANTSWKNYHIFSIAKSSGKKREIHAPHQQLKTIQRKILDHILHKVPLNDNAEGFRPFRSVLSNARHHLNKGIVLKFDIQEFFPSITSQRVFGLFLMLGYPRQVSSLLSGLTSCKQKLPTGAPTSPAIANIICRKLDSRLVNLGKKTGFSYSRYADDITISGDDRRIVKMIPFFKEIIREEGFAVNEAKQRLLRNGGRQTVTGVIVNEKPNISKNERRMLRAVLHNCQQGFVTKQKNRWAIEQKGLNSPQEYSLDEFRRSLLAKIHYVKMINSSAGEQLLASYRQISWLV